METRIEHDITLHIECSGPLLTPKIAIRAIINAKFAGQQMQPRFMKTEQPALLIAPINRPRDF